MRTALVLGIACISSTAVANDRDDLAKLVSQQIDAASDRAEPAVAKAPYADGVKVFITDMPHAGTPVVEPTDIRLDRLRSHADKNLEIQLSRDGKTAWVSVETEVTLETNGRDPSHPTWSRKLRISDVVAKIDGRWKIVASAWSEGVDNAQADKSAQSPKPPQLAALVGPKPDPWLEGEMIAWKGGAIGTTAAKRTIVFGSAPGERTTDGAAFRKAWYATWVNYVGLEPQTLAALAPSGTTGWLITNLTLSKKTYKVPFRLFVVFDKAADDHWQLVHAHFATTY